MLVFNIWPFRKITLPLRSESKSFPREEGALERCQSGRMGRSRKPLCPMGTQGSNPCLSANRLQKDFTIVVILAFKI